MHDTAVSRDGTLLAVDSTSSSTFGIGHGVLQVWNLATDVELVNESDGLFTPVTGLTFSPDDTLVAGADENSVDVWNATTGAEVAQQLFDFPSAPTSPTELAFGPNGTLAIAAHPNLTPISTNVTVRVWNVNAPTKPAVALANGNDVNVTSVAFNPNGAILATADSDGTVRQWNPATGQQFGASINTGAEVDALAFSRDGSTLATGGADKAVRLWNVSNGQGVAQPLTGATGPIDRLAFSADGHMVIAAEGDGKVGIWHPFGRTPLATLTGHSQGISAVAYGAENTLQATGDRVTILASGSYDATVRLWNAATDRPFSGPFQFGDSIAAIAISKDGSMIAVAEGNAGVQLNHGVDDLTVGPVLPVAGRVDDLAFSPDGRVLATDSFCDNAYDTQCGNSGRDGVQLWDTATERELGRMTDSSGQPVQMYALAFSPTTNAIVGVTASGMKWWDLRDHIDVFGGGLSYDKVLFSPNGQTIVAVSSDNDIRFFDAGTKAPSGGAIVQNGQVGSVAVSPDSALLAVGRVDGTIQLYDMSDHQPIGTALNAGSEVPPEQWTGLQAAFAEPVRDCS